MSLEYDKNVSICKLTRYIGSLECEVTKIKSFLTEEEIGDLEKHDEISHFVGILKLIKVSENKTRAIRGSCRVFLYQVLNQKGFDPNLKNEYLAREKFLGESVEVLRERYSYVLKDFLSEEGEISQTGEIGERGSLDSDDIQVGHVDVSEKSSSDEPRAVEKLEEGLNLSTGCESSSSYGVTDGDETELDKGGSVLQEELISDKTYSSSVSRSTEGRSYSQEFTQGTSDHDIIYTHSKIQEGLIERLSELSTILAQNSILLSKDIEGDAKVVQKATESIVGNFESMGKEGKRIDKLNDRLNKTSKTSYRMLIFVLIIFTLTLFIARIS